MKLESENKTLQALHLDIKDNLRLFGKILLVFYRIRIIVIDMNNNFIKDL